MRDHQSNAQAARSAGLVYVTDRRPGIRRVRHGRGFRYVDPRGRPLTKRADLDRIARLAIPPAWTDVWICPHPRGHLQACGRDARRRKQYRYHADWRQVRDEAKYDQMLIFATALPAMRRQIARDLSAPGLPRRKVVAAVVQLLEKTLIRVGNDEYARDNHSYGLTTMRNRHVKVSRSRLRFRFKGKSGKPHDIAFDDVRLARIVRRCQDLPGHELFGYVDDEGNVQDIGSSDVNDYLREITGQDFTAKSFRTWAATVLAACALQELRRNVSHRRMPNGTSPRPSKPWRGCSETRLRSAGRATSILPFSTRTPTERCLARGGEERLKPVGPLPTSRRMETAVLAWLQRLQRGAQRRTA